MVRNPADGKPMRETTKGFIALAHELVHAEHQLRGGMSSMDYNKKEGLQGTGRYNANAPEEDLRTIGIADRAGTSYGRQGDITENMLRQEHGLQPRMLYNPH
jgi:hypothetical protein